MLIERYIIHLITVDPACALTLHLRRETKPISPWSIPAHMRVGYFSQLKLHIDWNKMHATVSGMAYTASGERHERLYPSLTVEERREHRLAIKARTRRPLPLITLAISAVIFAGFIVLFVLYPPAYETPSEFSQVTPYVARPTPAIDALGESLTKKPDIWTIISNPDALFQLRSRELLELPLNYTVREHGLGGREDVLSFGNFAGNDLHLHYAIYRMGDEAPKSSTFFVDLARRSAESEVGVINTGRPLVQETKFGPAEIADATLSYNSEKRQCTAFRLMITTTAQPYQMSGWACDEPHVTPEEIVCFVDHLALTPSADNTILPALFANADQHLRPECGGVPVPIPPKGE